MILDAHMPIRHSLTVLARYYAPFVYNPPPSFLHEFAAKASIFISNLSPPDHGRTLRLRRTGGRLELTVAVTYWPAIHDQEIGYATAGS